MGEGKGRDEFEGGGKTLQGGWVTKGRKTSNSYASVRNELFRAATADRTAREEEGGKIGEGEGSTGARVSAGDTC